MQQVSPNGEAKEILCRICSILAFRTENPTCPVIGDRIFFTVPINTYFQCDENHFVYKQFFLFIMHFYDT